MSGNGWDTTLEQLTLSAALSTSSVLSMMLNDGMQVADCRIYYASAREALLERLRRRYGLLAVSQTALGAEPVKVSLIVGKEHVGLLLDRLMGRPGGLRNTSAEEARCAGVLDATEIDALRETANIVTGACAAVFGRELGITSMSLPSFASQDMLDDIVGFLLPDREAVCTESHLKAATHALELDLLMSIARKCALKAIGRTNGSPCGPRDVRRWGPPPART
jgi:hypothetical protein